MKSRHIYVKEKLYKYAGTGTTSNNLSYTKLGSNGDGWLVYICNSRFWGQPPFLNLTTMYT